jgi:hypothetical protein
MRITNTTTATSSSSSWTWTVNDDRMTELKKNLAICHQATSIDYREVITKFEVFCSFLAALWSMRIQHVQLSKLDASVQKRVVPRGSFRNVRCVKKNE